MGKIKTPDVPEESPMVGLAKMMGELMSLHTASISEMSAGKKCNRKDDFVKQCHRRQLMFDG